MRQFERLLTGTEEELGTLFAPFSVPSGDPDGRLEDVAQRVGVNPSQIVCGFGFNRHAINLPRVMNVLGFSSYDALWSQRNYVFINDVYFDLSIDNVVDIYREVGQDLQAHDLIQDLILSRLNHIESQIESTINPVMLGGYKLELRSVYENGLVPREMVETRLRPEYQVLRNLVDEAVLIVRAGVLPAAELLARDGVSPEEKRRLLFHELVTGEQVQQRLCEPTISEVERKILSEALASSRGS